MNDNSVSINYAYSADALLALKGKGLGPILYCLNRIFQYQFGLGIPTSIYPK